MKRYSSGKVGGVIKPGFLVSALMSAACFVLPSSALAYVGPGAGLTMLGSAITLIVVIIIAIVGLIIWPLRAIQRLRRGKSKVAQG